MFTLNYQNAFITGFYASKQVEVIDQQAKGYGVFNSIADAHIVTATARRFFSPCLNRNT